MREATSVPTLCGRSSGILGPLQYVPVQWGSLILVRFSNGVMRMDLDKIAQLLKESIQFLPPTQELTLFSISGRGYFENPTTDLLAFFFDPNQAHGFRDLLLRSFLTCMGLEIPDPLDLSEPPQREEI